mgnify:CR=1 FL=1
MTALDWSRWPDFSEREFRCPCGCGRADMDPGFMDKLQALRTLLEFSLPVSSGFRCPEHNTRVSNTGAAGPHTTGRAADLRVAGERALNLVSVASKIFSGLGVSQKGNPPSRFVHVDNLTAADGFPRPNLWSY